MTALNVQLASVADPSAHDPKEISKLKFKSGDKFLQELKKRVDAYFEQTGKRRRDCPTMYFKTATIFAWLIATYVALVFFVHAWWLVIPLAALIGLAVAGIGFNVQHDGGHKAYSEHQWINRIMAASMVIVGASSYIWDLKHNSIHHTYTNIAGHDDDIDVGVLGRLSPQQPRFAFHRFQGVYMWLLYGFLAIKWHLFDDFHILAKGRIGGHKLPLPKGKDLAIFVGGKIFFFGMFFVLPMFFHRWYDVLGVYAIAAFVSGVTMSVVFQLAHCVEGSVIPGADRRRQRQVAHGHRLGRASGPDDRRFRPPEQVSVLVPRRP